MSTAMERARTRRPQRTWVVPLVGVLSLVGAITLSLLIDWPIGLVAAIPVALVGLYFLLVLRVKRGS